MSTVLKIENLTKKYSGLTAVNGLNIDMQERTIHSLIGPNGSGKSTTVDLVTGFQPLTAGSVSYRGEPINGQPIHKIARRGVGRTFQNLKLFKSMTVLENLMIGGHQHEQSLGILRFLVDLPGAAREERQIRAKAEELLHFIGLYELRNENIGNISYGRQKVTELGRALMTDPQLLFLDEPAAGLNPTERVEFVNILTKTFESGVDLFLIEHNMDVVMNISHRITVINFGAKIAEGGPEDIQNNQEVITAYLGDKYQAARGKGDDNHAEG